MSLIVIQTFQANKMRSWVFPDHQPWKIVDCLEVLFPMINWDKWLVISQTCELNKSKWFLLESAMVAIYLT